MFRKPFSKNRLQLVGFLVGVGIGASTLALAKDDPENPKPWPERILRSLHTGVEHGFVELSSALFDSFDKLDSDLFKFPGNSRAALGVRRDVVDNFDLMNTYTVIDRVRIRADARPFASLTTWTEDVATKGLGTPFVGLVFEPQASIEWTDVRPVKALEYKKEPTTKMLIAQAKTGKASDAVDPMVLPTALPSPSPDVDLSELNPDVPITFLDPSIRARFSKVTNLATFPFRLPLHRSDVSKMKDGEILSYAFDGQVEVGVSAGLKVIPSLNVLHAGIDLRGTVLLHGRYQISVLREDPRYARVKLTHLTEKGTHGSVRVGIDRRDVFDGVMLFKGTAIEQDHVLKYDANFLPFDFESSRIRTNQFDVVYRYDLDDPVGKAAYHKAVLGKFAESETLTGDVAGVVGKPVEKLLSRDSDRSSTEHDLKLDLVNILRLEWNGKREVLEATLDLPDGTHHVLEAFHEKKRSHSTFFGATNRDRTRRMTLYLDAELLAKHDPQSIFVITEITEEDSNTNAGELNKLIAGMEKLLRKPDLLPAVAETIPGRKTPGKARRAWYGRSSFYYGYSLAYEEVDGFLRADFATIDVLARKYFDGDEAQRLLTAWGTASAAMKSGAAPDVLFQALRGVFSAKFSIEPLTNVIFDSIPTKQIDYFVTAQNVAFGRIQDRGKTIPSVEQALTNTDRELGFETYAQRLKQDSEAIVTEIHVDERPNGLKNLRFTLAKEAANVFFRLFRVTGYKKQKKVTEIVINNRSHRFKTGENVLPLDPNSPDLLTAKLSRDLRRGEFYNLSIAYSRTTDRYGPVVSSRFECDEPYPSSNPEAAESALPPKPDTPAPSTSLDSPLREH